MNFKKVSLASGAMILAAAAVFAGVKKFSGPVSKAFYTVAGVCHNFTVSTGTLNFTTGGTGTQATIRTSGNVSRKLWSSCSAGPVVGNAVHFKVI